MIRKTLAKLSDTPLYQADLRAFDVHYRTSDGDERMNVLTYGQDGIGQQIGRVLFTSHPEATDYSFREFDYIDFQFRTIVARAVHSAIEYAAFSNE